MSLGWVRRSWRRIGCAGLIGVGYSPTSRVVVPLVGRGSSLHAARLLTSRRKSVWAWTRVVGEVMDLTSLGMAIADRGARRSRRRPSVSPAITCKRAQLGRQS
jgi:hypothetical protein